MSVTKVALLQMDAVHLDPDGAAAKGEAFCRAAHALGADIALFPEMWNAGYRFPALDDPDDIAEWHALAVDADSPYVRRFRDLARELDMAIALTYLERWPERPRNSVSVIDRHGNIVLTYAKVHTCEWGAEAALTPGDGFPVAELDTAQGVVKVGCMICFDREFPESARLLMLNGAELILTPNACDIEINRLTQFRARAFENALGVAMANYSAPAPCNGHSVAYDGMAYHPNGGPVRDTLVVEAGEQEGVYIAPFDMDSIRTHRARTVWGSAYRRPRLYGGLVAEDVREPFGRSDATR